MTSEQQFSPDTSDIVIPSALSTYAAYLLARYPDTVEAPASTSPFSKESLELARQKELDKLAAEGLGPEFTREALAALPEDKRMQMQRAVLRAQAARYLAESGTGTVSATQLGRYCGGGWAMGATLAQELQAQGVVAPNSKYNERKIQVVPAPDQADAVFQDVLARGLQPRVEDATNELNTVPSDDTASTMPPTPNTAPPQPPIHQVDVDAAPNPWSTPPGLYGSYR